MQASTGKHRHSEGSSHECAHMCAQIFAATSCLAKALSSALEIGVDASHTVSQQATAAAANVHAL